MVAVEKDGSRPLEGGESERGTRHDRAMKLLEDGISQILDSESFANYLRTMSRFHNYSANNVLLILSQFRHATKVAGYKTWQSVGRQVRKGEKGIVIFVPFKSKFEDADGNEVTVIKNFGTGIVFDISQTDGDELPTIPIADLERETEAGTVLTERLKQFVQREGVKLVVEDTKPANGYYSPDRKLIALDVDLKGDQIVKTLTHEVIHHVAEHNQFSAKEDRETVAEGAAFVVLNHFGIDSSDYTFGYVAGWAEDKEVLHRNLVAIQKTSKLVINAIERMGDTLSPLPNTESGHPGPAQCVAHPTVTTIDMIERRSA